MDVQQQALTVIPLFDEAWAAAVAAGATEDMRAVVEAASAAQGQMIQARVEDVGTRSARDYGYCDQFNTIMARSFPDGSLDGTGRYRDSEGWDCRGDRWTDADGFGRDGFNDQGRDRDGFDRDGRDRGGFDRDGNDRDGVHRDDPSRYMFDRDGYNREGYDRNGYDRDGWDSSGYDRNGYGRDGANVRGFDRHGRYVRGDGLDEYGKPSSETGRRAYFTPDGWSRYGERWDTGSRWDADGYDWDGNDRDGNSRPAVTEVTGNDSK